MIKNLKTVSLMLLLMGAPFAANAVNPSVANVNAVQQNGTCKGVVKDAAGEAIIGASVVVKGTTNGSITDFDGNFELSGVKNGAILQVSYVGYMTQEVKYTGQALNVILKEDNMNLEEVVVVGYGTQKKANLTGSVANVNNKLIESRPITSVSAGLQGLLPGVTVTQRSGQPGADNGTIRVRGTGTFNVADPMVIVDGVESTMNDIDANDIESISVLKDAASAAIYGSKAANGVILITTKRGKSGQSQVNYSGLVGWQALTQLPEYATSAEYAELTNQAYINVGKQPLYTAEQIEKYRNGSDPDNYANTDWHDLMYTESGFQTQHNISINGGTDQMRYMASVGYQGQEGLILNTSKDQYNMRLNLDGKPKNWLETSFSMSYSRIDITEPNNPYTGVDLAQFFRQVNMISPMVPYKRQDGTYGTIGDGNPIAWLENNSTTDYVTHNLQAIGSLKFIILPELSVKATGAYKLYDRNRHAMVKVCDYGRWTHGSYDKMYENYYNYDRITGDVVAEYKDSFGAHNVSAMAGYHAELYKYKETQAYRENFPSNSLTDLNAGGTKNMSNSGYSRELAMLSYFGRVNYDFAGKYLLEGNVRYDGTSRFARGNRWGFFPSVSAGWRISEEAFFETLKETVNSAKFRASWGQLGNQDIGNGYYPTITTMTLGYNYPFGGAIQSGAITASAANPMLQWEKATTWGFGLDMTLWNKLNVTVDYYDKTTDGILMSVATPVTFALGGYYDNIGKVNNRGVEISADFRERIGKVDITVGGNIAFNKNEILEMGETGDLFSGNRIYRKGEAMNSFYGYKSAGLFQSWDEIKNWPGIEDLGNGKYAYAFNKSYTVQPGDIKYKDLNGDKKIDANNDRAVLGTYDPGITFGFNLGATYKGWDIMAFFQGATDVYGYMETEAIGSINGDTGKPAALWLDNWNENNKDAKYPRLENGLNGASMPSTVSDFWLQNGTYLRLKNLQIGYTFPKAWMSKLGINKLRVYYSGQNILTFTNFLKGWDPEAPAGRGNFYPQTQVNSFGVNVTF
ncbi:MAG: TonB-dependent receptor [Bacteroidaceae bacterium]|nr:TonB-dependent receptor [Bacteroidaceae bacterium]